MGRTLGEMIDALPKQRRERIEARYRELRDDVESLRELRKLAGRAQADIAATLKIKQPSVSKIEKQKKRPAADVKDAIRKYIRKRHARG